MQNGENPDGHDDADDDNFVHVLEVICHHDEVPIACVIVDLNHPNSPPLTLSSYLKNEILIIWYFKASYNFLKILSWQWTGE